MARRNSERHPCALSCRAILGRQRGLGSGAIAPLRSGARTPLIAVTPAEISRCGERGGLATAPLDQAPNRLDDSKPKSVASERTTSTGTLVPTNCPDASTCDGVSVGTP